MAGAGIRGFPTFQFLIGGRKVDEVVGANVEGVKTAIANHSPKARVSAGWGAAAVNRVVEVLDACVCAPCLADDGPGACVVVCRAVLSHS